jgi:hypothetical protein
MSEPVDYGKDLILDEEDLNYFNDLPELKKNLKDLFDLLNGANKKLNNLLTDLLKEEAISHIKYDLEEEKNTPIVFMARFLHKNTYHNGTVTNLNNIYEDALKLANKAVIQAAIDADDEVPPELTKISRIYDEYNIIRDRLKSTIKSVEEERKKPNKQIDEYDVKIYELKNNIAQYNRSIAQEKEEKAKVVEETEGIEEKAEKERYYNNELYILEKKLKNNKERLKTITDERATSGYRKDILKKQMDKYIVVFLSEKLKNVNLDKLSINKEENKHIYRDIYVNLKFIIDNIYSIFKGIKEIQDNSYQAGGFRKKNNLKPTVVQSKEILGKIRRIYKVAGSRKEHIKYKGELISVSDYKKLVSQAKALKSQNKPATKSNTKSAPKPKTKSATKPTAKAATKPKGLSQRRSR